MARDTRTGLSLAPNMRLKLTMTEKENTTYNGITRICQGIESRGYEVKVLPDVNHPQAILVKR